MTDPSKKILLILDDREFTSGEVRGLVGSRRYGDIIFKRRTLADHFRAALPEWAKSALVHVRNAEDLANLRVKLEESPSGRAVCVVAARAGFSASARLTQLVERLPFAEESFTDRLYKPLLVFLPSAHDLVAQWTGFAEAPLHTWARGWIGSQRLESLEPQDLGKIREFLLFITGSTAARHFNEVEFDNYYYTKRSSDKRKMLAEYSFYGLVPESMRPWLIQPFGFADEGQRASYRMLRYYLADAALQWVHGAFDSEAFAGFADRLLFFLSERPRAACSADRSVQVARNLFVSKVEARATQFLGLEEGKRINTLVSDANPMLDLERQLVRYKGLFERFERGFALDHLVVGHGDPCFSNVLYDQQRYLLKLIDPKGAVTEDELWTHPLYDLCKVSHSALGGYDFINNGLYRVSLTDANDLSLVLQDDNHGELKAVFRDRLKVAGYDERIIRLGEASLFLSMLPLHIDHPKKVVAFMLKARQILDEVEGG